MPENVLAQSDDAELERNAYNAAFVELGFRWHWNGDTYHALLRQSSNAAQLIRHYLETRQAHLLKAYDVVFLVEIIHERMVFHRKRISASGGTASGHFDWAETIGCELGA